MQGVGHVKELSRSTGKRFNALWLRDLADAVFTITPRLCKRESWGRSLLGFKSIRGIVAGNQIWSSPEFRESGDAIDRGLDCQDLYHYLL